ncbi:MAG: hypothetical protein LBI73_13930 [Myroides sp.]|jgi:hypothetical protein|nr:hypothetical protein [Myroides sp.]
MRKFLIWSIKGVSFLLLLIVFVVIARFGYLAYLERSIQPKILSNKEEVINVMYVNWACDCANFIDVSLLQEGKDIDEKDCIFIEPNADELTINSDTLYHKQFDYYLRLKGQYYIDEGVPSSYERKIVEPLMAPNKAKVFRYTAYEFIRKE